MRVFGSDTSGIVVSIVFAVRHLQVEIKTQSQSSF